MILKQMLKGALVTSVALFHGLMSQAQHKFVINGQLDKDKQGQVFLAYQVHGVPKADSAKVVNGAFLFKGEISDPVYSTLELNRPKTFTRETAASFDGQQFFLEEGTYTITGGQNIATAKIVGGKAQEDFRALNKIYAPYNAKLKVLQQQISTYKSEMNDTAMARVLKENGALMRQVKEVDSLFIAQNPDSYTAFDLWRKKHRGLINADIEPAFKHFTKRIQNTEEGVIFAKKIEEAKRLSPGKQAPDFTLKDTLGHDVTLSSFKGKNVLLCFWFADFANFSDFAFSMNKINRRLKDKNFTIVSVYFDNGQKKSSTTDYWKKVLNEFSINSWTNLSDIGGIQMNGEPVSAAAKAYAIGAHSLPLLYLIGPDGKILARSPQWWDKDVSKTIESLIK